MFDDTYLKEIAGDNQKFIRDVLIIFLEESAKTLQILQQHVEAYQQAEIKKTAHKLKSSLHAIGENHVATIAEIIEKETEKNDKTFVLQQFDALQQAYHQLTENIKLFLKEN